MCGSVKKKILLVDDEVIIALAEKLTLEKYGYEVDTVTTGEKAVTVLNEGADVDLILMDIDLGKGLDGTETAALILQNHDLPILFVSSHMEPDIVAKTEKITSYGYVVKSSSITVLDASIKMAFKLHEAHIKEMNLTAQLQLQATILDRIVDHVTATDLNGTIRYVNDIQCRTFGKPREEIIGQKTDFFGEDPDRSITQREIKDITLKNGSWSGEVVNYDKDHKRRIMNCRTWLLRDAHDVPQTLVGIATDVTGYKNMEHENLFLIDVIKRSSDFIGVADPDGKPVFVNPAGCALVGLTEDEVKKTTIMDFFLEEDRPFVEHTILPALMSTGRWRGEFRFRHFKTGAPINVFYDLFLTENPETGELSNITTITREIKSAV